MTVGYLVLFLDPDHFDSGVSVLIRAASENTATTLCTARWDADKRDLWEIPEACDLFWETITKAAETMGAKSVTNILCRNTLALLKAMQVTRA